MNLKNIFLLMPLIKTTNLYTIINIIIIKTLVVFHDFNE